MAFLFERDKSVFWWVSYRHPKTGRRVRESTGFRRDLHKDTRDARAREAELTLAERRAPAAGHAGRWADWVPDYLAARYRGNAKSHARYVSIWKNLQPFLREADIESPRALTREHAFRFFRWRQQRHPGIRPAAHNTAILELKILGMLCKEAIRRGYTLTNPVADLGLKKIAPQKKPALRPEHFALIESAIEADTSPWKTLIERAYLIARHQGIRINETWINPQTHCVLAPDAQGRLRGVLTLHCKGGKTRDQMLAPELIPLFQQLKSEGATETYHRPMNGYQPRTSRIFQDFLTRHGLRELIPGVTHHCLRVSAATNMARAGVRKDKAMEFLGHDSETVHSAYVRFRPEDFDDVHAAVGSQPANPAKASR